MLTSRRPFFDINTVCEPKHVSEFVLFCGQVYGFVLIIRIIERLRLFLQDPK